MVILADYPVQHFCPLYKELARNRSIGTIVIFANSKDVDAYFDEGLKKEISWGNGILEAFLYVSFAMSVSDVVDQLDVSAIESVYEEEDRGQPPYHPRMMTKIPLYGYCVGVFSSRRIQKRLVEDVAFRVLAAGNQPDFRSETSFESAGRTIPAGVTPGVRGGSAEVGTCGFGWEQGKGQRDQAQGHELWTDGGDREAAAGGSS
ncbi:MAG: hypothetical protein DMG55_30685 [Acidobacteria bacterium]|nr:MAG: hypothetical protein DMG55_30685 [Acidobacteriota bacterium]